MIVQTSHVYMAPGGQCMGWKIEMERRAAGMGKMVQSKMLGIGPLVKNTTLQTTLQLRASNDSKRGKV